ncbi:MAG: hypothetical protein KatS3mg013_1231 [Actinomycetota bacterium]|nr:MAG: hypothetical protein KatS3mg013_1231 [Actinomycetota bacterium]
MTGLPDARRESLRRLIREARRRAEKAYEDRLRALGLWTTCSQQHRHGRDCYLVPQDRLNLSPEDRDTRAALEAALEREEVGFPHLLPSERAPLAVLRLVRGAAFTLLNRLAALRAMEVRGLVTETVVRRPAYGGRSLREYRIAQAEPGLPPDRVTDRALREGFAEAAREIGALFDPDDPYGLLLPDPRSLRELLRLLGEDVTEVDWRADDVLGWIYQYYQDEAREGFRGGRGRGKRRAADADEMAAINCLYTPHWVVRALVDNSLGRLLLEQQERLEEATSHRWSEEELRQAQGETVAEFCRYLVPPPAPPDPRPPKPLREIRVLDPACGSGHFLIYAFDVLWRAYREAEPDVPPEEHAATILERNLFGIDIDLRACQLAALGLYLKAKEYAPGFRPRVLNVVCADARILDGERRQAFLRHLGDDKPLQRVAERLLTDLRYTAEIGSLLRVREPFEALFRQRRTREAGQAALVEVGPEQLRLEGVIPRERTLGEILEALRAFEREAVERSDMGGRLFAADAERSLGLLSLLSQRYDVVLMNPPYNKRQELPAATREYLSERFGRTHHNIYAAFIEQAVDLAGPGGFVGMLTPLAYMYLGQLRPLRAEIIGAEAPPELVLEFGWDILDPAQIQTAGTVLRKVDEPSDLGRPRTFFDLTAPRGSAAKEEAFVSALAALRRGKEPQSRYVASLEELAQVPGSPYAYWAPAGLRRAFSRFPPLDRDNARKRKAEKIADVKQGLATADDARFTRRWWEVPVEQIGRGRRWAPFVKGEEYARYYHDPSLVVLWEDGGKELREFERSVIRNPDFYFREGLTWQRISVSQRTRTRYLPPGSIFDANGPSIFLADPSRPAIFALLGIVNSSLANLAMLMLTPDRSWQAGQVSFLPIAPAALESEELARAAQEIHDLLAAWGTGEETSTRFVAPRLLQVAFRLPERPGTGHPLAQGFAWPSWDSWRAIASLTGSPEMPLGDLLSILAERRRFLAARVSELEEAVDREVFRCYGLEEEAPAILDALRRRLGLGAEEDEGEEDETVEDVAEASDDDLDEVRRLLSYYARQAIEASPQPVVPLDPRAPGNLVAEVRELIRADWGEERSPRLEDEVHELLGCSLEDWLTHEYFPFHVRLYRNRPISWLLWSAPRGRGRARRPTFACFVDYRRLTEDTLRVVRGRLLARSLDQLRAEAERLEREATEARIAEDRQAARVARAAEDARARVGELERYDARLAALLAPTGEADPDPEASWLERMVWSVRAKGYRPDLDLGVLVNITPLREAGVLHPAAERVR